MIYLTSNREPERLATRLCDLIYGAGGRCRPDPAPEIDDGWMVGDNNDVWLVHDAESPPGHYRLVFRHTPNSKYLEALATVIVQQHIAREARSRDPSEDGPSRALLKALSGPSETVTAALERPEVRAAYMRWCAAGQPEST
jgi:hypothetical protein